MLSWQGGVGLRHKSTLFAPAGKAFRGKTYAVCSPEVRAGVAARPALADVEAGRMHSLALSGCAGHSGEVASRRLPAHEAGVGPEIWPEKFVLPPLGSCGMADGELAVAQWIFPVLGLVPTVRK